MIANISNRSAMCFKIYYFLSGVVTEICNFNYDIAFCGRLHYPFYMSITYT